MREIDIPKGSAVIYAISSNTDPSSLPTLISLFKSNQTSMGCLIYPFQHKPPLVSCSIAAFPSDSVTPFRSTIPGKAKVSIGRWQRPSSTSQPQPVSIDHIINSRNGFQDVWSSGPSSSHLYDSKVPEALRDVKDVSALLYFSDGAPEGLLATLDKHYPHASKLGLIGTSTPFVTGREHTLLLNSDVFSDGAIGFALKTDNNLRYRHGFNGLQPISEPYTISSAASNLVYTLDDDRNPTKEALAAYEVRIRPTTSSRDAIHTVSSEMYLGVIDQRPGHATQYERVHRITSGDPSRGTLSLDTDAGPPTGSKVQFLYRPPEGPASTPQNARNSIQFIASSVEEVVQNGDTPPSEEEGDGDAWSIPGKFIAHTENGVLITSNSASNERPDVLTTWRCSVPGGWGSLRWPTTPS
ncbi:hypothetical protein FRB99_001378 [Tulasnella sp. 403]|nr:hypothetical protein FRB99_001378 [Tulasnella sp. 403]